MTACSFCGRTITPGTGILFVRNDAKLFHFCSSKCRKYAVELKRKSLRVRWARGNQQAKQTSVPNQAP